MNNSIFELKDIFLDYVDPRLGKFNALENINLSIKSGEYVSLVGPSGSGKTSLANILGLLVSPTRGKIFYSGRSISDLSESERIDIRGAEIGFIFQDYVLIEYLTVLENVALTLSYQKISRKEALDRAALELNRLGLSQKLHHLPKQLSGGQKQRVAIARALLRKPKVILADEPTGALDQQSRYEVLSILQDLNASGMTIVTVTHSEEDATASKRIIRIEQGKIVDDHLQRNSNRFFGKVVIEDKVLLSERVKAALSYVNLNFGVKNIDDFFLESNKITFSLDKISLLKQFRPHWISDLKAQDILLEWIKSEDDFIVMMTCLVILKSPIEMSYSSSRFNDFKKFFQSTWTEEAALMFFKEFHQISESKMSGLLNPLNLINHKSPRVRASAVILFKYKELWNSESEIVKGLKDLLLCDDDRVISNTLDFLLLNPYLGEGELKKMNIPFEISPRAKASWCRLLISWGNISEAKKILSPMLESSFEKEVAAAVWVMAREDSFNLHSYIHEKLNQQPEFIGHLDSMIGAYKRSLETE